MSGTQAKTRNGKRVVFLHPDLGIGGAERLVIDAAVGLQSQGCKVTIYTSHCDPNHCFTEAKDGTLDVRVRGNTIFPPTFLGRFAIFCAIARQIHMILTISVFTNELRSLDPTHFFVDQLSAGVPLLRLLSGHTRILFYCHFPDKLLALQGSGIVRYLKLIYRYPFNWLEGWSTSCSDDIVVNSKFTGGVVKSAFPSLRSRKLKVVYPCVDVEALADHVKGKPTLWPSRRVFLSINRFERKKDVALAIRAFSKLGDEDKKSSLLVIAGGYDSRVPENVSYLQELQALAGSFKLNYHTIHDDVRSDANGVSIIFMPSVKDTIKQELLDSACLLIYTPRNEHFGIVPVEGMLHEVPVLAADEGGPTESIVNEMTGWLRSVDDVEAWAEVMRKVIYLQKNDPTKLNTMGKAGKLRVEEMFGKEEMAERLDDILDRLVARERPPMVSTLAMTVFLLIIFGIALSQLLTYILFWAIDKDKRMAADAQGSKAAQGRL
ncbi:Alpha-1,3/1,6-mannosyltransferase ALG2 [Sphaceloma murrayae]|uniref:Alpha-1,3/1,6-mannosyltransferase ALG2 n=1 Tax=Sphaceloma murrayae TaxID=2082308 RepID=A0A2K1QV46_9PEZI|nr:Alpha-1,3/1,6-mannosyltransferase ALG2 [Sphaceloma murrayae]